MARALLAVIATGLVLGTAGCPAFHYRERDVDRTPTVDTGAGASIIYPGQTAPMPQRAPQGAPGSGAGAPDPDSSGQGAAVSPGQSPVTFIGGASQDEDDGRSVDDDEDGGTFSK